MTWLSEGSNVLDDAIEDEIRKELDLIEISDENLDENNEDLSNDTSQDVFSLHEDGTTADDAICHYASQLEKRASAFEQELLECDDLLTAAIDRMNVQVLQESWKLLPVHTTEDQRLTSAGRGLSEVDDNSESSDDDYLAIEWQLTTNAIDRNADVACSSSQSLPSANDGALAIIDRTMSSGNEHLDSARMEGPLLQIDVANAEGGGNVLQRKHAASLATAASRERYRHAMVNMEKDHDELKAKFDALEHQSELERAERAAKLQRDADVFRQKTEEKGEQLQKELDAETTALSTYAAELQEHIRKMDFELNQERMNLHSVVVATQAREREVQHRAAVTVQAVYRGYRVRKTHAATLLERAASRREEAVASRVRQVEAERQLAAEAAAAAERRRLDEEAAEARRQLAEAEAKRKAEEAKAAEARQRAEEAAEAKRKAKEAKRKAKEEAAEAKRKAEEEEAKRKAEEAAEARRKAEEAAEAKRRAKEKAAEERRLRKEAEREARRAEQEQLRKLAEGSGPDRVAEEKADLESYRRDDGTIAVATDPATVAQSAAAADATAAQTATLTADRDASAEERNLSNENITEAKMRGGDARLGATHSTTSQSAAGETVIRTDSSSRGVIETSPMLMEFAKTGSNAMDTANVERPVSFDHRVLPGVAPTNSARASSTAEATAAADVVARQRSEQRLAEMQLLKERMEKLQPNTAVLRGSSGSRHPPAALPATGAIATAVAATPPNADGPPLGLDMSLVGSKMEERRLRWMKECVPWSSIRAEAINRKVSVQLKKSASKKQNPAASATSEVPASSGAQLIAAVADEAGTTTEKVQAFHVDHVPDCSLNAAWSLCPDLKAVIVRHCQLVSLEGLSNDGSVCAPGLLYVDCQANCIEKLPAAAHLDRLTVLDLTANHLTSMTGLETCPSLRCLCLAKNKLTRIAGLASLRILHTLDVSQNQLINTKGVGDAVSLQFLDVSNNHLSAVDDVDRLCLLERLSASGNNIREVPKLQNAVLLRELLLGDNSVSSLGSLSHSWLPSLKRLVLNHNSLSSLAPLHGCPLLRFVDLGHNQLVDVHNVADALKFCVNLDELLLDGSPVACRTSYRAQLHGLLPRMRLVDGVTLSDVAVVSELHPSDFLKACDIRSKQAADLHQQWLEHTRVPTDRKLAAVELLRLCSVHCAYFEQSSSHAQDSRSMHEYGELSEARVPCGNLASVEHSAASNAALLDGVPVQGLSERSSAATTMTKAAPPLATPKSAVDANPRAAASEHTRARSGDARHAQGDCHGIAPPASSASVVRGDASSTLDSKTADIGGARAKRDALALRRGGGGRSSDDSDDEIDAVGCANRASGPSLAAVSKAASTSSASGAGSHGNRVRRVGPRESVSSATAESKDAFEERLRAALESTSKRLLEQSDRLPGAASVSDAMRATVLSAAVGNSSNNCVDGEHRQHGTGAAAATSRNRSSYAESSFYNDVLRHQPTAAADSLQLAATRIQATWRGYALRKRLNSALRHARVDSSDVDDFSDYGEVDVSAFDLEEARLDESWLPSQTPQLPKSHAALPSRFGLSAVAVADVLTIPSSPVAHEPRPPVQPRHAWRNQSSGGRGSSAAIDLEQQQYGAREFGSFSPALSGAHSHRSGLSRKEELLAEEWGFKDHRTAELMVQRAKKLKYDAIKKKKLRMLDPQQKLAFLRRLEESTRPPVVQVPARKAAPKLEYFEAMEAEARRKQTDKRAEQAAKEQRMYEWVHTQVGDHYDSDDSDDASPSSSRRRQGRIAQAAGADGSPGWQHSAGSQDSLPYMEKRVIQGGRALLVASPLDLQSVDSREHEVSQQYRRNSQAEPLKDGTQLPPIKTNSAQSSNAKKERISFRDNKVDLGPGWGGGRKRNFQR